MQGQGRKLWHTTTGEHIDREDKRRFLYNHGTSALPTRGRDKETVRNKRLAKKFYKKENVVHTP